jgi:Bacterial regulatory helix-turn-helix protein, lysR family
MYIAFAGGVAVVEERQIAQAAVRVGTAQPWVSCQLREVEEEVGVKLFKRVHIEATVMRTAKARLQKHKKDWQALPTCRKYSRRSHNKPCHLIEVAFSEQAYGHTIT